MGCAHRCTFCYVRGFERRADRPSDDRYGRSIRVKTNVVSVLSSELARPRWAHEVVAIGAATGSPTSPPRGRFRLTRGCIEALAASRRRSRSSRADLWWFATLMYCKRPSRRARVSVSLSVPTVDDALWRVTEPGTAHHRASGCARCTCWPRPASASASAMAPILPGLSDKPELLREAVRAAREAGAAKIWTEIVYLGTRHLASTSWRPSPPSGRRKPRGIAALYERACVRAQGDAASQPRSRGRHS
jgi:DNA repair photolyase